MRFCLSANISEVWEIGTMSRVYDLNFLTAYFRIDKGRNNFKHKSLNLLENVKSQKDAHIDLLFY